MPDFLPPVREEFDRFVREALNHLYDSPALEKLPLLNWFISQEQISGSHSQHLRRMLINVIQSFKPGRAVPLQTPDWRGYQILEQRFITGLSPNEVIMRLNISRSLFFIEQARMIKCLTDVLWEKAPLGNRLQFTNAEPQKIEHELSLQSTQPLLANAYYQAVPLQPLLDSLYPVAQSLASAHQVEFVLEPSFSDRSIPHADRVLLRQVIISLIAELVALVPGGKISLGLSDRVGQNGPAQFGVHLEAQAGSADTRLIVLGGRQGLSPEVCRELIAAMGGALTVQMVSATEYSADLIWRTEKRQHCILLVDDQPDLADLFRRYLKESNWQVVHATSSQAARNELAAALPDVIMLDVIMPQEDGWEFLVEIKGNPSFRNIPIVVCSAVNEPELVRSLGADGYLPKPIMQSNLLTMLKKIA